MRLEGHPGAAARAVRALLGGDARFTVSNDVWRLVEGGLPLRELPYAVVDVETTGGPYSQGHRIIEVAIVEVREGRVQREYRTLVNPGRSIPTSVFRLNGLSNRSVAGAPYFDEIAEALAARLRDRVFVAHNVEFDWRVLQSQLGASGERVETDARLCTLRMARRLLPDVKGRSLDALADTFDIPIYGRHRAFGDAMATARILIRLLDMAEARGLMDLAALEAWLDGSDSLT
jgi:DNA polymerase-3 subunit epsilon